MGKTALYEELNLRLASACRLHYASGGGGGCCGTDECLAAHPLSEFEVKGDVRTDLPACQELRFNDLCGVVEALLARVEELETGVVAPIKITVEGVTL